MGKKIKTGQTDSERELYESIVNSLPYPFYVIDPHTYEIIFANTSNRGYIGRSCFEASHHRTSPCEGPDHPCILQKVLKEKKSFVTEHIHYDEAGRPRNIEIHMHPVFDAEGEVSRIIEYFNDITEQKQREREKDHMAMELYAIYENVPFFLCVIDGDHRVVHANQYLSQLTGLSQDELFGEAVGRAFGCIRKGTGLKQCEFGQDCKNCALHLAIEDTFKTGHRHRDIETNITISKKGEEKNYTLLGSTSLIQRNGNARLLICLQDITEQRENKRLLQVLSAAVSQSPVTVVITDREGIIEYTNPKFTETTGYTAEEALGQKTNILKGPNKSREEYRELWQTILSGKNWQGTFYNRRKDGSLYWEEAVISPVKDKNGNIRNFFAVKEDITERKKMEEQLLLNEKRLRLSQEYAHIGTWDWDILEGTISWSETASTLLGLPEERKEMKVDEAIALIHPDDRHLVEGKIKESLEENRGFHVEHRYLRPDGSLRWLQEDGNITMDDKNSPLHMLGIVQDITDRKQQEAELILSREEAHRANMAKSEFLSSMSHELRTPMNAIMGFGQLLEMDADITPDQRDYVKEIRKAADHLLDLINDILDLSRIETGRIEISPETIAYDELLKECFTLLNPLAEKKSLSLIPEYQPGIYLTADRLRLKQVLINLLTNAIKYNKPEGYVKVRCSAGKDKARISVEDNGKGIPADRMDQLFEPFNRLGKEMLDIEGTGIGLTISKKLVELMDGSIGAESEEGIGSTFWIDLPMSPRETLHSPQPTPRDTPDTVDLEAGPHKILYIEDNPSNLRLVEQILHKQENLVLFAAPTPAIGLELAEAHRPELVLLDLNLPEMDGFTILKKIRNSEWGQGVPVVAVSASAMADDIEEGRAAGFDEYLTKPLNIREFLTVVQRFLHTNGKEEK